MKAFGSAINKRVEQKKGITDAQIERIEIENPISIPSDYRHLLNSFDGISFLEPVQVSIDKRNPIVQFDNFLDLEWLVQEKIYDVEEKEDLSYVDNFLKIGLTYSRDRILIGTSKDVLNQIYFYDYEKDESEYICDSLIEFINLHLLGIED